MYSGGNLETRLGLAFHAYDLNGDGVIDRNELFQIIKHILFTRGTRVDDLSIWQYATMQNISPSFSLSSFLFSLSPLSSFLCMFAVMSILLAWHQDR